MAKIFRFHTGNDTLEDWANSQVYGKTEIEGIKDPTGATARKQITSIPSPFARIDLVQTAFHYMSQKLVDGKENSLDGDTIYHKLVSDALDVGEILFNIDQLKDEVSILAWDKTNDLNTLLSSPSPKHRLYGETLKLYLEQDAGAYNFDLHKRFYLLVHNYKVIGGTSPATLFFTTANDLSTVKIPFGSDWVFDGEYQPLYKRDAEFQKYLHHLFKTHPELGRRMKEVYDYLGRSLAMLEQTNNRLFHEINNLKPETFENDYDALDTGTAGEIIDFLGFAARKRHKGNITNSVKNSDFIIKSTQYKGEKSPLVLQNNLNKNFRYTTDPWNKNVEVPVYEPLPLESRTLPGQIIQYPYLTVSDFLEDYIIRIIYPTDKEKFFDGNLRIEAGETDKGYLLPLKPLFFEYFSTADLQKNMPDGKPMIEMVQRAMSSLTVTLRIPVAKEREYITFERVYYAPLSDSEMSHPNLLQNKWSVTEGFFNVVIFPFFQHPPGVSADYRVMVIDRDTDGYRQYNQYQLSFYLNEQLEPFKTNFCQRSDKAAGDSVSSSFYVLQHNFDYIRIDNNAARGMLIPLLPKAKTGNTAFSFAIDFGTSNTHIEWKKAGEGKKTYPLEITTADLQYAGMINAKFDRLLVPELTTWVDHELFPPEINTGRPYHFPHRTLLSFAKKLKYTSGNVTHSLADFNIPFIYERLPLHNNTDIRSNLKWSDEEGIQILVRSYFENLALLIRNKVLLNGGNLEQVAITTFFPSSMDWGRRRGFNDMFTSADGILFKYFSKDVKYTSISESLAPYYYAASTQAISSGERPVATIDIGGGTTDIMVFFREQPSFLTSFRFASHALFGDGFNGSSEVNGFVKKYFRGVDGVSGFAAMVDQIYPLPALFEEMEDHSSADIISFLFSLADNQQLIQKNKKLSLFESLKNDKDLKIILVVFTGAVIYHLAKCMCNKKMPPPKTIILSGNGSKIFNMAEGATGFEGMSLFAEQIFRGVYEKKAGEFKYDGAFKINFSQDGQPKQITCKGGLYFEQQSLFDAFNNGKKEDEHLNDLGRIMDSLKYIDYGGQKPLAEIMAKTAVAASDNTATAAATVTGALERKTVLNTGEITYDDVENLSEIKGEVLNEVNRCLNLIFKVLGNARPGLASIFRTNEATLDRVWDFLKASLVEDLELGLASKRKELRSQTNKPIDETLFFYPLVGALNKCAYSIVLQK
jgi:hypothetical protein